MLWVPKIKATNYYTRSIWIHELSSRNWWEFEKCLDNYYCVNERHHRRQMINNKNKNFFRDDETSRRPTMSTVYHILCGGVEREFELPKHISYVHNDVWRWLKARKADDDSISLFCYRESSLGVRVEFLIWKMSILTFDQFCELIQMSAERKLICMWNFIMKHQHSLHLQVSTHDVDIIRNICKSPGKLQKLFYANLDTIKMNAKINDIDDSSFATPLTFWLLHVSSSHNWQSSGSSFWFAARQVSSLEFRINAQPLDTIDRSPTGEN